MIEVSVAEDQRIHPRRVDFQQIEIVGIDARGEAEIQQIAARLAASRGFDVQREAPLAFERFALRRSGKASALHGETGTLQWTQKDVVRVVGNFSYDDAVDHRRVYAGGCRMRGPSDAGGNQRAAQCRGGLQEMPAIQ
jgi:hypothetical protein